MQHAVLLRRSGAIAKFELVKIPGLQRITMARHDARSRADGAALRPGKEAK
jgi:hypothetical protein